MMMHSRRILASIARAWSNLYYFEKPSSAIRTILPREKSGLKARNVRIIGRCQTQQQKEPCLVRNLESSSSLL